MMVLLKPFEIALNVAIQQDKQTYSKLSEFEQRQLLVEVTDLQLSLLIQIADQRIQLSFNKEAEADLTISGQSIALIKLGEHPDNLFSPDIKIHGDVQFAKQLQHWLAGFEFDWEQHIANITGDVIAQPINYGIKLGFYYLQQGMRSLQESAPSYLREKEILPQSDQIDDYLSAIDTLRADTDRLEARINRLEAKQ
jgi:ubiquinone biosynthesis protein UbiJ